MWVMWQDTFGKHFVNNRRSRRKSVQQTPYNKRLRDRKAGPVRGLSANSPLRHGFRIQLYADTIVDGSSSAVLAFQIAFCGVNRDMPLKNGIYSHSFPKRGTTEHKSSKDREARLLWHRSFLSPATADRARLAGNFPVASRRVYPKILLSRTLAGRRRLCAR